MHTRRTLLMIAVAVVVVLGASGAWVYWRSDHGRADCNTAHDLIAYNTGFSQQMRSSTGPDEAATVTTDQYRQWSTQVKDYADRISNPELSGYAHTAAELANRISDLVPRYRAKPDDADVAREYAGLAIEYANAITRLENACLTAN